jgi:hypothetical protein
VATGHRERVATLETQVKSGITGNGQPSRLAVVEKSVEQLNRFKDLVARGGSHDLGYRTLRAAWGQPMKDFLKQCGVWFRSMVSEPDGTGSSSQALMLCLAGLVSGILGKLFDLLTRITDPVALGVARSGPCNRGSLVAVFLAPYGVNKSGATVSEILASVMRSVQGKDRQ